jgi:hypothetical protein
MDVPVSGGKSKKISNGPFAYFGKIQFPSIVICMVTG